MAYTKAKTPAKPQEMTPEEKAVKVAMFLQQKRESFALSFFAGLSRQPGILSDFTPQDVATMSVTAADALIDKLYPKKDAE